MSNLVGPLLPEDYEPPLAGGGSEPKGGKCETGNGPPASDCLILGFFPSSGKCVQGCQPAGAGCELGFLPIL